MYNIFNKLVAFVHVIRLCYTLLFIKYIIKFIYLLGTIDSITGVPNKKYIYIIKTDILYNIEKYNNTSCTKINLIDTKFHYFSFQLELSQKSKCLNP